MIFDGLKNRIALHRFHTLHLRSPAVIRKWQDYALQTLVDQACKNVPLWRQLFTAAGVGPESVRSVDDLDMLPITNKRTYAGRMTEEYVNNAQRIRTRWRTTSGSTGTPFSFLSGNKNLHAQYDDFSRLRFLLWKSIFPVDLSSVRAVRIKMSPEQRRNRLFLSMGNYRLHPEEVIKQLIEFKPTVVESYATILLDVANRMRADPVLAFRVPYAVSYGEKLLPAARKMITDGLGAEVYDRYGIEEIGAVSIECEQHNGQHVYVESVIIEIVDEHGKRLPSGEHGRIVITDLLNYNMPFIRYDTGDRGMLIDERCACGLQTPRLFFDGRYSASLRFGEQDFHHLEFDDALHGYGNSVIQYQIVKRDANHLSVNIIPGPGFTEAIRKEISQKITGLVGSTVTVAVNTVETISDTPRGKSRTLIDESISS